MDIIFKESVMRESIILLLPLLILTFLLSCSSGGGSSSDGTSSVAQTPTSDISLDGPFIVYASSTLDEKKIENLLIPLEDAQIRTYGLTNTDIKVRVSSKNGNEVVIPKTVSIEDETITFTVPLNIVDGEIAIIDDKGLLLTTMSYKVYNPKEPYLVSIEPGVANPGDSITISGQNLSASMQLMSKDSDLNVSVLPVNNQVVFTLPADSKSGELYLKGLEYESNVLYLSVKRELNVKVTPPQDLSVSASAIAFAINSKEYPLNATYETTLVVENSYQQINATVELLDGSFSHLYSAVVLADMTSTLLVDANSTAVSWIFLGLGASNLPQDELRTLYEQVSANSKVQELASYMATLQKEDFLAWSQLSDPVLKTTFQEALTDVLGQLEQEQLTRKMSPSFADSSTSLNPILTITPAPSGNVYVNDIEYGYIYNEKLNNGSVTVVNDTQLYLSVEATATDGEDCMFEQNLNGDCIINHYQHVQSPFKMDASSIISPSKGVFGISVAQTIRLDGKDAHLEIITGGSKNAELTDKPHVGEILQLHSFINGVVTPVLDMVLSPLLGKMMPSSDRYQNVIDGFRDIYGTDLLITATSLVADKDTTWGKALDTLMIKPLTSKLASCVSLEPDEKCTQALHGIAKLYGVDSENYVKELTQNLIAATYDRVVKRVIVAVPVAGWVIEAAIITYEAYDTISTVHLIAGSLVNMSMTDSELNFDVDFHFNVDEVLPTCVGVSSSDYETSLYVKGEGFKIEGIEPPEVLLINEGGLKRVATSLNIPSFEKIYATFDAQSLIDNRSVSAQLFVDYGDFFTAGDDEIRIVDEGDSIVHFDSINPDKAVVRSTIQLRGCGWLPLNDVKVFFTTSEGEMQGEVVEANLSVISVKVPDEAIDGYLYATAGNKRTRDLYFEVEPFGLLESDIIKISSSMEIVLYGMELQDVTNAFFTDSSEARVEGVLHTISVSSSSIIVDIPQTLKVGEVKVFAVRDDGLESNALTLSKSPKAVTASPDSQGFDGRISVSLSQAEGLPIYYYNQWDEDKLYTSPITIIADDIGVDGYKLYAYSKVNVNGVEYKSEVSEYAYVPSASSCPMEQDTSLHGYHTTTQSWLDAKDTDGDGYFDDYLLCSYYFESKLLLAEEPYLDNKLHGTRRTFYEDGRLNDEEHYLEAKREGLFKSYYDSPQLRFEGTYVNDYAEGTHTMYYDDGVTWATYPYVNGQYHGVTLSYYQNTKKRRLNTYDNGIQHGLQETYYESAEGLEPIESTGYKVNSVVDGVWTNYYETGDKESFTTYDLGVRNGLSQTFYDDGLETIHTHTPYLNGKKHGNVISNFTTGYPRLITPYVDGLREGVQREYDSNNYLETTTTYANDMKNGMEIDYYDLGATRYSGWYKDNLRHGEFKSFSESTGEMTSCIIYENDYSIGSCMPEEN